MKSGSIIKHGNPAADSLRAFIHDVAGYVRYKRLLKNPPRTASIGFHSWFSGRPLSVRGCGYLLEKGGRNYNTGNILLVTVM